ncbi:hypothetical protein E8E11_009855 [Didymella keratinophila]|nr:hypothetical protein E8E11_009855 [Didymella keratinophila]
MTAYIMAEPWVPFEAPSVYYTLAAATKQDELVQAHAIQLWLYIGIPSFRNLRFIVRDRAYVWLALFLSSVPLHLINSVAITSLQGNEYMVIPTTEDWLNGAAYNTSGSVNMDFNTTIRDAVLSDIESLWPYSGSDNNTYVFFLVVLFGIVCITRSLIGMPKDIKELWNIGFGTISGNNLLDIDINLTGAIVIANVPQVLLSYLYLAFNALYTSMLIAREWSAYSHERNPLRVTRLLDNSEIPTGFMFHSNTLHRC